MKFARKEIQSNPIESSDVNVMQCTVNDKRTNGNGEPVFFTAGAAPAHASQAERGMKMTIVRRKKSQSISVGLGKKGLRPPCSYPRTLGEYVKGNNFDIGGGGGGKTSGL